ncbi:MAG: hypothetical protein FI707_02780 [SAR202 cluster bacterium]|nr:hypothetical protein [Chloroflexota bacterium]MDP6419967.1 hypothetical protein [SAR202 cluster bacterium]HAL49552.1 hypothetical protein [Dehalococcoidia bacterium]MDP6665747.1 hypothetical protein [SAR202 cluster bacterium]MDP6798326.1 hypothetical protein [SAR202 cluster bacterium]
MAGAIRLFARVTGDDGDFNRAADLNERESLCWLGSFTVAKSRTATRGLGMAVHSIISVAKT